MMDSRLLQIVRAPAQGEPAALVATWIMGELLGFGDVTLDLSDPDSVRFRLGPGTRPPAVRRIVRGLLSEARFAGWALLEVEGEGCADARTVGGGP